MSEMLNTFDESVNRIEHIDCDNIDMSLQERINELLNGPPITKAIDLAVYCGISRATVSAWTTGKVATISGDNAFKVARYFGVNPEWVQTGKGRKTLATQRVESNAEWSGSFDLWDSSTPLRDDEVELPFFREVELAAGEGKFAVQENFGAKLRFSKATLRSKGVQQANAACVKVSGNSMEPVLPDGATIGIDTGSTAIKNGEMYAIDHDGHLRVKMVYQMPGSGLRLRSFNSDEWPDEHYSELESKKIKIIGRVFWYAVLR
ncbi:MAG: LexA family transcriptional regulator [Methylobacter sp.]